jgi:hypothetical protein
MFLDEMNVQETVVDKYVLVCALNPKTPTLHTYRKVRAGVCPAQAQATKMPCQCGREFKEPSQYTSLG